MFEAYKIGVTLELKNLISPQLTMLAAEFEKLDGLTIALKESLGKISLDAKAFKGLSSSVNSTNRAFEKAAISAGAFHREIQAIRATGAAGLLPGAGGGRPGGGGGGGGGGGAGRPSGIHGGNIHLGPGGVGLGTAGFAAGDWFWPLAATGAAAYGGMSLFQSAKDLDIQRQKFRLFGMSEAQNQEAFSFVDAMRIYGTTRTGNQAAFNEAQGVGRESGLAGSRALDFAKMAAPTLARLDALGAGMDDESAAALHQSNLGLLRYAEQTGGLQGAEQFNKIADRAFKLRQSSGGTIDYQQLRMAAAMGGRYTQSESDLGWAMSEPVLQVIGGSKYGTGVATAGGRLFNVMSQTPKNLIAMATDLGLWTDKRQHLNDADSTLFKDNFVKFYTERLMPLYASHHFSESDVTRADAILLGRTGSRIGGEIQKSLGVIGSAGTAFGTAKSMKDAGLQLPEGLSGQEKEFEAAWTDFKTQWGTSILPFFTGILKAGAALLRPRDENTPWYTDLGKAAINPIGAVYDMFGGINQATKGNGRLSVAGKGGTMIHTTINIDGQRAATAISPWLANPLGPQTTMAGFDASMGLPPPGGF